ncbi:alpha-N-arabinofuranosidase [Parvularcula oceani]|uniref:alpha-N-arabinofuranosidase n=1 Tax=Parvularcula oceani TaxID=1247963 RepID=UPI0004E1F86D|nr:alpha-L-arabinofuranosidase C-terminal domain-containing protein [Parvularcula oceani]
MINSLKAALAIGTAAATLHCAAFAQQGPTIRVSISDEAAGDPIEPEVYGHFAEHLGRGIYGGIWVGEDSEIPNTNGYRNDVLAALEDLEVPVLRWPGGCFADEYNWRDGIGPREERPVRINTHWGWVTDDNAFGTHEFLNFAERIGADAYVAGNMGSGSPREMSRWIEYMTSDEDTTLTRERAENGREEPWDVPYFGVGNESWGCGGHMTPEYSAELHNRYATFVDTPPGMDMTRVATGANVDDYNFTEVLMRDVKPWLMDAVSLHYYTFPGSWENKGAATGFDEAAWASTLKNSLRMDDLITEHVARMDEYDPEGRVALYVDEWGTWYDSEEGSTPGFLYQQNSIRDALVAGLTLNIFHRHTDRVKMANIAQMVNVLQASILTDGPDMILTPTYHSLMMYKPFKGATPLEVEFDSPNVEIGETSMPHVDVSAARQEDGTVVLSMVNLSPDEPARIRTGLRGSVATGQLLTADEIDAHNTFEAPERVVPTDFTGEETRSGLRFELPPRSLAVVTVDTE